ncbi:MAG: hypothetical protein M3O26_16640 [Pseudomonadota bacterium]|nr:hypothetical protein [Pseudomonadota bacterium]
MSEAGFQRLRRRTGAGALALGLLFGAWLPLGLFHVVPFVLELAGETALRTHAAAAVACLMVAAWGFWED